MSSQVSARLARLLLAVAFVLAGQAALLHPLTHVDAQGGLVHVPGKDGSPGKLCDVLGALSNCLPDAPQAALAIPDAAASIQVAYLRAPRPAEAPPFLSQGPPALL